MGGGREGGGRGACSAQPLHQCRLSSKLHSVRGYRGGLDPVKTHVAALIKQTYVMIMTGRGKVLTSECRMPHSWGYCLSLTLK